MRPGLQRSCVPVRREVVHRKGRSGRLSHRLANNANNGHQHASTNAAAGDAGYDAADVEPACVSAGCGTGSADSQSCQNLAADSAAENANDGIASRSKTEFLEKCSGGVATDRAADQLNDQAHYVHDGFSVFRSVGELPDISQMAPLGYAAGSWSVVVSRLPDMPALLHGITWCLLVHSAPVRADHTVSQRLRKRNTT